MAENPALYDSEFDFRIRVIEWMNEVDRFLPVAVCTFDGTAGSPTPDGRNVSSITKNGTGDYTLSFIESVPTTCRVRIALGGPGVGHLDALTTSSVRVKCFEVTTVLDDVGAAKDFDEVFVEVVRIGS